MFGNTLTISITKTAGPITSRPGGTWSTGTRWRKITDRSALDRDLALLFLRCGDEKYETAVDFARRTPDRIISPQDPTIAYRGAGYFGRSLFFELDAHAVNGNWPSELPESIQREVAEAKYVVQVRSYVPTPMFEQALVKDHFYPMDFVGLRGSVYTLWTRGPE